MDILLVASGNGAPFLQARPEVGAACCRGQTLRTGWSEALVYLRRLPVPSVRIGKCDEGGPILAQSDMVMGWRDRTNWERLFPD